MQYTEEKSQSEKHQILREYGWYNKYQNDNSSLVNKDIFDFYKQLGIKKINLSGTDSDDYTNFHHIIDEAYDIYLKCQHF